MLDFLGIPLTEMEQLTETKYEFFYFRESSYSVS